MAHARTNGKKTDVSDVAEQIDIIKADIANLNKILAELADTKKSEAKESAASAFRSTRDAAYDTAEEAREAVHEAGARARGEAEAIYAQAETQIRRQPGLAVGIAAGLGFLVGVMATRRN